MRLKKFNIDYGKTIFKSFSDISRIAGVDATDWSWGALIFDMDKDGLKDPFYPFYNPEQ